MKRFRVRISSLLFAALLILAVLPCPVSAEETQRYINVSQPATNIIGGLVAIQKIHTGDDWNRVTQTSELKPAAAQLTIRSDLSVIGDDGSVLTDFDQFLRDTQYSVIPVLRIEDTATADAVINHLTDIEFYDVILMSTKPALIHDLRSHLPYTYAAIDYTEALQDVPALTKELCLSIRKTVWENGATIAYLPSHLHDADMLDYLYHRQITVWLDADGVDPYEAILSGAIGLVTKDTETVLDIAYNKLPENTMTRSPLIIGHRGINKAPENTVEGARLAYESGCDSVELDIMLTADGEIVVNHDDWTGRNCNENLYIPESTLAQLKELYVNVGFENNPQFAECRIPTLREFLTTFQDTDCQLTIEIKTQDPNIVPKMCALLRELDMVKQCNVISFWPELLSATHAIAPEIPLGYLCTDTLSYFDLGKSMQELRRLLGPINATFNPGGELASIKTFLLNCRGVSSHNWTFDGSASQYAKVFLYGVASLTTNDSTVLSQKAYRAEWKDPLPTTVNVGDAFTIGCTIHCFGGHTADNAEHLSCTVFEDNEAVSIEGATLTFVKPGTYTLFLTTGVRLGFLGYEVPLSRPVTVTVMSDATGECATESLPLVSDRPTDQETPTSNTVLPFLILGIAAAIVVTVALILVFRKKH